MTEKMSGGMSGRKAEELKKKDNKIFWKRNKQKDVMQSWEERGSGAHNGLLKFQIPDKEKRYQPCNNYRGTQKYQLNNNGNNTH